MDDDVIDVQAEMKEGAQQPPFDQISIQRMDSLKTWGWVSYGLHLVVAFAAVIPGVQASIGLLLIAIIIDWVRRPDAVGTWQYSHYSWRIRSVIWAGLLYLLTAPLWLLIIPGAIAWVIISVWFLYRIVRGMVCMRDNREIAS